MIDQIFHASLPPLRSRKKRKEKEVTIKRM